MAQPVRKIDFEEQSQKSTLPFLSKIRKSKNAPNPSENFVRRVSAPMLGSHRETVDALGKESLSPKFRSKSQNTTYPMMKKVTREKEAVGSVKTSSHKSSVTPPHRKEGLHSSAWELPQSNMRSREGAEHRRAKEARPTLPSVSVLPKRKNTTSESLVASTTRPKVQTQDKVAKVQANAKIRFKRGSCGLQMILEYLDADAFIDAFMKQISRGGVLVQMNKSESFEQNLELHVHLIPPGFHRGVWLKGRVQWNSRSMLGVRFEGLTPERKNLLVALLDQVKALKV
jgi:hypothetical protein